MARTLAIPTLSQLHRPPGWFWVYRMRYVPLCQHHAPMALAPLIIRWGQDFIRHAPEVRSLHRVRPQGRYAEAPRLEERRGRVGAVPD